MSSQEKNKDIKRESDRRRHQAMYSRRAAAGLCRFCQEPRALGVSTCAVHREKSRVRSLDQANKNREQRKAYFAEYNKLRAEAKRAYMRGYTAENASRIAEYKRSIRPQENARKRSPEYRAKRNELRNRKKREDPQFAMADRLRKRIGRAIRDHGNGRKNLKTAELIGCSMTHLMAHLESQFLPGMSWENRNHWHIDHIRPCALFDLTDPQHQRQCFHYKNLQPLWAQDNIRKHVKFEEPTCSTKPNS